MGKTQNTAFWSLETISYILMSLASLFSLPIVGKGRNELAIRWCFAIHAVFSIPGSAGYVQSGNPLHVPVIISLGVCTQAHRKPREACPAGI